ncbi:hypothetical protein AB0I02_08565 [Streptomyces phaeochromogenes]
MPSAAPVGHHDESAYDRRRLRQWLAGEARADGVTRRRLLTLLAATAAGTALGATPSAHAADRPIVKTLPPEWFIERGTNAETRWEALRGTGLHTPNERAGASWRPARLHDRPGAGTWSRWSLVWRPDAPGATYLLARATDTAGRTQPDTAVPNTQGYLFDAVVRHPVSVV